MRGTTKDLESIFKRIVVPLPVVSRSDRGVQIENNITNDVQESVEIEDLIVEASLDVNIVAETQVRNLDIQCLFHCLICIITTFATMD